MYFIKRCCGYFVLIAITCDCSVPLDGKNKAVEVKCMAQLVALLGSPDIDVRANAAGAIMM